MTKGPDGIDPTAPIVNLDGTPVVTAEDGETKVTQEGPFFVLESRKGDVKYRLRGDDEKSVRAYFKANPEKCIVGQ